MPNEVIHAIHTLAAANKKHKGIVFTDRNGNIINDNSPDESDNTEITGVSTGVGNISNTERNISNTELSNTAETNNSYISNTAEVITQDNTLEDEVT